MLILRTENFSIYARLLAPPVSARHDSVAERAAVHELMREAFPDVDPVLSHAPSGAPLLLYPEGYVLSVTHSRRMVAIAVAAAGVRIGIDTDTPDRHMQLARIAPRFLSPAQMEEWGAAPAPALLVAWCVKEALYKAALTPGLSLHSIPLPSVDFISEHTASVALAGSAYTIRLLPVSPDAGPLALAVSIN